MYGSRGIWKVISNATSKDASGLGGYHQGFEVQVHHVPLEPVTDRPKLTVLKELLKV
jgi:hypothetical protein